MTDNNFTLLVPYEVNWEEFYNQKPDFIFSDLNIDFLNEVSSQLLKDPRSRKFPDVISFAFFCRKGNLKALKVEFESNHIHIGRGCVFHIAPGNVPVNFAYSFVAGVLAGNNNIVKVSSKDFPQVDLILEVIRNVISQDRFAEFSKKLAFVKYDRTSDATAFFSKMADARIIWGGDHTIETVKKNPVPPRSVDVCFSDRYSIAVINPGSILKEEDKDLSKLAEAFYNDTYLFDQNACSAPHLVFWLNRGDVEEAKKKFWDAVHEYARKHYEFSAIMAVDKETAFYRQAVDMNIKKEETPDNIIYRADLIGDLQKNIPDYRSKCGYFVEHTVNNMDEIAPIISHKYQTMVYHGFDKETMIDFVKRNHLKGLDKIVPFGDSTKFSLIWDGYNLISMLSRIQDII